MVLNFPKMQEIKLNKPPLDEVICQVRFLPILSIARELPTDFQESIRDRFPGFEVQQGVLLQFPTTGVNEKPIMEPTPKIYRFLTADKRSSVALTTDFCAITTKSYCQWSTFIEDLNLVGNTVVKKYHPSHATRIGLRFINKFTRKNTKSKTIQEILALFREELTCLIQTEAWQEPNDFISQMVLADNHAKLALRVGFGKEQKEPFFVLDFDYFEDGQLRIENLTSIVQKYHAKIYDAFRWCLKNESLERFEPITGD
jgi:uncharacterized protein (TIGR04255 family)